MNPLNGYRIALADGSTWRLTADRWTEAWLKALSRIMGLGPASGDETHVIRVRGTRDLDAPHPPKVSGPAPSEPNWQCFRHGGIHRIWRHDKDPLIVVELNRTHLAHPQIWYINMWSTIRELHRYGLFRGGTPVHGALAALNGRGVLIAASGGTGKSTCHGRLPDHWEGICDDQAFVLNTGDGCYRVHPFPTWSDHLWAGSTKEWRVERSYPLERVFFLEQAAVDEVRPVTPSKAVSKLYEAAREVWEPSWSRIDRKDKARETSMLFMNVSEIARSVPAYRLLATREGEFWKQMERALLE